ncbi:MAG: hypothetical protein EZS28_012901 [Streblomastix strix]|uniref:Uncharacterized protein n=1 Tax=Streblomastix strix TaxID=222440 RepID=A0A5J4W9I0_9EUKA|nr:MAG: hypothetical protein EZS28_012901 [Streblomastix strix]
MQTRYLGQLNNNHLGGESGKITSYSDLEEQLMASANDFLDLLRETVCELQSGIHLYDLQTQERELLNFFTSATTESGEGGIILHGPAKTGKTATILNVVYQLAGSDSPLNSPANIQRLNKIRASLSVSSQSIMNVQSTETHIESPGMNTERFGRVVKNLISPEIKKSKRKSNNKSIRIDNQDENDNQDNQDNQDNDEDEVIYVKTIKSDTPNDKRSNYDKFGKIARATTTNIKLRAQQPILYSEDIFSSPEDKYLQMKQEIEAQVDEEEEQEQEEDDDEDSIAQMSDVEAEMNMNMDMNENESEEESNQILKSSNSTNKQSPNSIKSNQIQIISLDSSSDENSEQNSSNKKPMTPRQLDFEKKRLSERKMIEQRKDEMIKKALILQSIKQQRNSKHKSQRSSIYSNRKSQINDEIVGIKR